MILHSVKFAGVDRITFDELAGEGCSKCRGEKEREKNWFVAMVITFTEQVDVLQGLEIYDRIVFCGKNSVQLHRVAR